MHFQVKMKDNDTNNVFIEQQTTNKADITFLVDINNKIRCTWCI